MKKIKIIKDKSLPKNVLSNYTDFFLTEAEKAKVLGGSEPLTIVCTKKYIALDNCKGGFISCKCGYSDR